MLLACLVIRHSSRGGMEEFKGKSETGSIKTKPMTKEKK
jgi:hypothetical protein